MRESTQKGERSAVAGAGDWSDAIPTELLSLVAEKIDSVRTKIAFAAVCRSWFAVISPNPITQSTPWLMLAPHHKHSRTFYSFRTGSLFDIDFPLNINPRRCWGSPFGWIITYNCNQHSGFDVSLYNPISRASIPLPDPFPIITTWYTRYLHRIGSYPEFVFRPRFIGKAVLTANPESPHCLVLIIPAFDFGKLLYAKPGDTKWSVNCEVGLGDILSFRGNLYGCDWKISNIFTLEISDNMELSVKGFALAAPQMVEGLEEVEDEYFRKKYLVDVGGELWLVLRYINVEHVPDIYDYDLTYDFEVYKLDFSTKVWKLVKSLGDYCLFIGTNHAFAVPVSSDHPFTVHGDNGISLRPNCIYFLDDQAFDDNSNGFDMGVFHVGERLFGVRPLFENAEVLFCNHQETPQPFMLKTLASGLYSPSCPPLWITPCIRFQGDENFDNGERRSSIDHHLPKTNASQLCKASSGAKSNGDKSSEKITPEDEDEERRKLIFQLKNQFTYREGHGVDRKYQERYFDPE